MLLNYLRRQIDWSRKTFGEGQRVFGVTKHIIKEVNEIQQNPTDLMEWIDVIILALDGAWRAGYKPEEIIQALEEKQQINFNRQWPPLPLDDEPSEHIRIK